MRILLSLIALLVLVACGKNQKLPEYSTGGRTFPYRFIWKGSGEPAVKVSVAGDFNGNLHSLWFMVRQRGLWQAFLHLTNGHYRYRFAEESAEGKVRFNHDPHRTAVFDAGWAPGSRDPRKRNCLSIKASGFVASNGKKLPLPGGVPVGR